jgi:hypothetical protein
LKPRVAVSRVDDRPDSCLAAGLCAVGAVATGAAVQVDNGYRHPLAFAWLSVAVVAVLLALMRPSRPELESALERVLPPALALALAGQFITLVLAPPAGPTSSSWSWRAPFLLALGFASVAVVGILQSRALVRRVAVGFLLATHFSLGVWMIRSSPSPLIDVFVFQRESAAALREGINPYSITFPNIYENSEFYGPGLVVDGRLMFGAPYPPLSLLLSSVAEVIAGDARFAQLTAMTVAGALMASTRPGPVCGLAAAVYLFTPRNFLVLEQSWTEPFLVLFLAVTVWCAVRCPRVMPYALGLFLAVKQYAVLGLPLAALLVRPPWTFTRLKPLVGRALLVAAAVSLPLALLDPAAYVRSVVTLQFHQPFRANALSYLTLMSGPDGHVPVGAGAAFLAAAVVAGLTLWRAPRTPAGFALGLSATFLVFFGLNKQAFCNYYFFVIGALCVAVAASDTTSHRTVTAGAATAP